MFCTLLINYKSDFFLYRSLLVMTVKYSSCLGAHRQHANTLDRLLPSSYHRSNVAIEKIERFIYSKEMIPDSLFCLAGKTWYTQPKSKMWTLLCCVFAHFTHVNAGFLQNIPFRMEFIFV